MVEVHLVAEAVDDSRADGELVAADAGCGCGAGETGGGLDGVAAGGQLDAGDLRVGAGARIVVRVQRGAAAGGAVSVEDDQVGVQRGGVGRVVSELDGDPRLLSEPERVPPRVVGLRPDAGETAAWRCTSCPL